MQYLHPWLLEYHHQAEKDIKMFQVVASPQEEVLLHNHSQTHLLALSTTCVIPHKDLGPTFNNFGCWYEAGKPTVACIQCKQRSWV
jgi:hypothetical protein